jgi:hypothetical protein
VHGREDVDAAGCEDPSDFGDDAIRVGDEHKGVLVKDDVELTGAESAQVAHVRS